MIIVLLDTFSPPPHVVEHSDHLPNGDQTQSTTKQFTLFRFRIPKNKENGRGGFFYNLSLYILKVNLPGQISMLHVSFLNASPTQGVPPFEDSCTIFRLEVLMPPPHDFEHSDHSL